MRKILTILALGIPLGLSAQSIERSVIASGGTITVTGSGVQLSQTIGEPMVGSFSSSTVKVAEGFQHANIAVVGVDDGLDALASFTIFPNPVGDQLNVQIESTKLLTLEISFSDILGGSTVVPGSRIAINGKKTETIDCSQLASGTYLLSIRDIYTGSVKTITVQKMGL